MRTVFRNHQEVCDVWAKQTQRRGKAGNISFSSGTIYSYHWWPMARIDRDVVLMRFEHYSQSTSNHQAHVLNSVRGQYAHIFNVKTLGIDPGIITIPATRHVINIEHYVERAHRLADTFWFSRNHAKYDKKEWDDCIEEARNYVRYYECEDLLPPLFGLELEGPKAKAKLEN